MRLITPDALVRDTLHELAPDLPTVRLTDAHMAEALRRAALLRCPCRPSELIGAVLDPLRSLEILCLPDEADPRTKLAQLAEERLDALLADGEFLAASDVQLPEATDPDRLIYTHPLMAVQIGARALLVGCGGSEQAQVIASAGLALSRQGARRWLQVGARSAEPLTSALAKAGVPLLNSAVWARAPMTTTAIEIARDLRGRLDGARPLGSVAATEVLLPPGTIPGGRGAYLSRWRATEGLRERPGDYIGRYPGAYGSRRWAALRLDSYGRIEHAVAVPFEAGRWPAHVVALRIAAAVHAADGRAETYTLTASGPGWLSLTLSLPPPHWVARQLSLWGEQDDQSPRRWTLRVDARAEVEALLQAQLWMRPAPLR